MGERVQRRSESLDDTARVVAVVGVKARDMRDLYRALARTMDAEGNAERAAQYRAMAKIWGGAFRRRRAAR